MFLHSLTHRQKELFLDLAYLAADANGVIENEEQLMLDEFSSEMGIENKYAGGAEEAPDLGSVLSELKSTSNEEDIRKIIFEITGILLSDNEYDSSEIEFMKKVADSFGISPELIDEIHKCVAEYRNVCEKMLGLIG